MILDRDTWQEIFGTIRKNKLRTFLTALGVFWGVFMLVFLLGMGAGLENGVYRDFGAKVKNIMFVWPGNTSMPYKGYLAGRRIRFKLDDVEAVKSNVPGIKDVAVRKTMGPFPIRYRNEKNNYEIRGEHSEMINITGLALREGRYINHLDIQNSRKVAVIGDKVKEVLFGDTDPIGKHIQIKGIDFTVVGIFGPLQIKPWTEDDMQSVVIPLSTMHRSYGDDGYIGFFVCSSQAGFVVSDLEREVRSLLKSRHNIHPSDPQAVQGFNLQKEFNQVTMLFSGIELFLWFVGIGTLIAGIVGVSNIMLIIVKERTKEIGIRKALGASPRSIISLILTESVFITSLSGYLGLALATFLIAMIHYFMQANNIFVENFYKPEVNFYVGIGAISVLILAGVIAGYIPAMQAARVNPVIALQEE